MFGFGNHHRRRCHRHEGHCCRHDRCIETLEAAEENFMYRVQENHNSRTRDIGLFPGSHVLIIQNRDSEPNMLVAIGSTRLVLSRELARDIRIEPVLVA